MTAQTTAAQPATLRCPMGGLRYFEKENGGVSTALNLGIKNMRGKYFSWLSHDDVYLPEKVQVEIDALREAGDMSRVVYGDTKLLIMPDRQVDDYLAQPSSYRREFLETGAFLPIFGLVQGCSLLIPKFYFDAYGGFEETFRASQDYKKWFEMFRGKRLIYVRNVLNFKRIHPEETGRKYGVVPAENDWLYTWIAYNIKADDLVGSGLKDLYHFYGALFTKYVGVSFFQHASRFVIQKLYELPESPDADTRAQMLSNSINDGKFQTYFPAEQEGLLRHEFALRGITLGGNVKFVPFAQFPTIKPDKNVRILDRDSLMQALIDTPIRKNLFVQWLNRAQGRQQA